MTTETIMVNLYLSVLAVTIFFTLLALVGRFKGPKKALEYGVLDALAFIFWLVSGIAHLAVSPTTSSLSMISYLYFVVAVIFGFLLITDVSAAISDREDDAYGGYGNKWFNKDKEE